MKRSTTIIAIVSVILLIVFLVCYGLKQNSNYLQNQENWKFGDWNESKSVKVDEVKPAKPLVEPTKPVDPIVPIVPESQITAKSYQEALQLSKEKNKRILIFFHATWCSPCKQMEKVFVESDVKNAMLPFIFLQIDVDQEKELCGKYNINSVPSLVIINGENNVKMSGYKDVKTLVRWLEKGVK